jgi:hypothetical protein
LRVLVVWFSMLPGDFRGAIDRRVLAEQRVTHYWDANRTVGRWFSEHVSAESGVTWDTYFLYDSAGRWEAAPPPALSSRSPVIDGTDELSQALSKVL